MNPPIRSFVSETARGVQNMFLISVLDFQTFRGPSCSSVTLFVPHPRVMVTRPERVPAADCSSCNLAWRSFSQNHQPTNTAQRPTQARTHLSELVFALFYRVFKVCKIARMLIH